MTAVCLKAKNSVETKTWSNIFTSFNTYTKSCLFIKQLTRTCISTILYLRKVLPDNYFEPKNFEGMTLKLLKSRNGEDYASKIEQWLEGAFEAIEKKYLKRLMLDIQDADSNMTLEIYTMTFNYDKEKEIINPLMSTMHSNSDYTISNTKLSAIKLLQMCHAVIQTYGSLPSQIKLSMRLSYYENTPEDYQPNGYMSWESIDPEFPKQAKSIEIGVIGTSYHFFKLLNKSCLNEKFFKDMKDQLENSNSVALPGATEKSENISEEKQTKAKRELCFDYSHKNFETDLQVPSKIKDEIKFIITEKSSSVSNDNHTKLLYDKASKNVRAPRTENIEAVKRFLVKGDLKIRCACLSNEKSEMMFPCLGCRFLVHAECFGVLEFDSSKKIRFYCHLCHQTENNYKCHDKVIIGLKSASDQQKLSILRRVLRYCTLPNVNKITLKKMEKIAGANSFKNVANIVLNKMIEIGVVVPQGKKKNYLIDKHELSNKLVHYFYKVTPKSVKISDIVKRKNSVELCSNKRIKQSTDILQKFLSCNNQT